MKKNMMNRTLLLCLTLFVLVVTLVPFGFTQAEGTDPGAAGLQRIGEAADASKPVADKLVLAVIGDYGDCYRICEHEQAVADMVHSWNPDSILTVGDNSYRLGTVDEVQADQKPYWTDIAAGRFYPIYGNHDYGNGCSPESLKPSLDFFKIPASFVAGFGNGLVDFVNPDVNCNSSSQTGAPPAVFDSYKKTVDESSANAKWVLVGGHQPIFSSGQAGNNLNRRWLLTPGVDLVLQGHDHHAEHIITPEGYNEVITGNGGQGLTPLFPPVPGSEFRDNSAYGAVRLTITPETLTVDYVNVPGTVVYSFTMKKDPFTKKAYIVSQTDWTDPNPAPGGGQQGGDKTVSMAFGENNEYKNGLDWFMYESGLAHEIELDGRTALQIDRSPFGTGNNLYMKIDDERIFDGPYKATASIEYRSPVAGSFVLQYESAASGSTYFSTKRVYITDAQVNQWQTAVLDMPAARFTNRQNGGADMRIVAANKLPLIVSSIKIDATPDKLPVTLWAIRVQPVDTMKAGETSQAIVKATYSDFSTAALTSGLTFASSDSAVASVDQASGLITAQCPGDTVITATYGELQDQYHLVVQDTAPPTTTLTADGTLLDDGSYLHEATVHLAAVDDYSGLENIEYSLDQGQSWALYSGRMALDQDGNNIIAFRSSDKAGNVEAVQTRTIKVTSATIANLKDLVKSETARQNGTQQSILSHVDSVQQDFRQAAAFRDQGNAEQTAHFETKGYDSLRQLSDKIEQYSDKQLDPAMKSELLTFVTYMIEHQTVKE